MKTRILSMILVLVMALVLFAGCGQKADEPADTPASEATNAPAADPAQDAANEPAGEEPVDEAYFPLAETEELSYFFMWSQALSDIMDDPEDLLYFRTLEERTNVHLNIQACSVNNALELYPVMIAGGDWCDMVDAVGNFYAGGYAQALSDDFIIPLNDYLQYMPNYTSLLESNENLNRIVYLDDGTMPSFGTIYNGGYPITYGMAIRTDYLDELGMELPRTIEQYHDVFTAFKVELGVKYPLWMNMYGAYQNNDFASAFDTYIFTTTNLAAPFFVIDDEVRFGPVQDGAKEYLSLMAQWYSEGLLYDDFMTEQSNFFPNFSLIQDLGAYTVPVGIFNQLALYSDDEDFAVSAAYDPVLNEGDAVHITYYNNDEMITGLCITSACEDPELAARYIDYWYSDEGYYILNWGVEGETYTIENGEPVYITDVVFADDSLTTDQCMMLISKQDGPFIIDYIKRQSYAFNDTQLEAFEIWGEAQADYLYPTNALLSTEEADIYSAHFADIATYIMQYIPSVIIGDTDIDSTWDEFVATCEELGYKECLEVKQAAYDRFISK